MLAGSYLTRTKVGSGNCVKYILGYMLPGKQKGESWGRAKYGTVGGKGAHQQISAIDRQRAVGISRKGTEMG